MKRLIITVAVVAFSICLAYAQTLSDKEISRIIKNVRNLPDEPVFPDEIVVIETDFGNIVIDLYENQAPLHCMNFKKLVRAGFYEGTTFHRVIPDFVIQGGDILSRDGDPLNDGTGSLGYTIPVEIGMRHVYGAIGAARLPDSVNPEKRSSASQFYICLRNLPHLDGGYTVFGKVIEGMDVVEKIASVKTDERNRPIKDVVMRKVYVTKRDRINQK
ncbi:MAG: peptidylprolyl isomerase [Candidatus Marinimicrobia bacterium]|nr:peptidylprolyl isomerase [Candidatus Neomarinimicrobiota bacterium]